MSSSEFDRPPETYSNLPEQYRPTFNQLQDNADAGFVRRSIGRYLFTRNPERSVKLYSRLGMPLVRKAIMGTYGRFIPHGPISNYRTDTRKTMIERSMRFAVGGSVFNESVHAVGIVNASTTLAEDIYNGKNPAEAIFWIGFNAALVGLQRYNRARMVQRINIELEAGRTLDPNYTNWLGIDGRSVDNYTSTLPTTLPEQPVVEPGLSTTISATTVRYF